ncbi:helix-turn-helix domain-containing protein [Kitasatospora sp. NPDC094011]|uniref:helix-turn-helix domain-containing protein n=1 Tax=Kitasatospora sp. NPDC094011 TaxID=3364090 RepID=UPI0038109D30
MRHDEDGDQPGGSPIGIRLARWRACRQLSIAELGTRAQIPADRIAVLESGRDWVDRRGELAALTAALRLDPTDLTGQPYPPADDDHAMVRAIAFQLRRQLAETPPAPSNGSVEELNDRTASALAAEAAGDEHALALTLPGLIRLGDAVAAGASATERQRAVELRARGHITAAGLLRRLGYKDLAWILLHRARPGVPESVMVLVEEVRLLIDLGLPEFALARAERAEAAGSDPELPLLAALAHAAAGRREEADELLHQAARRAVDPRTQSAVTAARIAVAAEAGAADEVIEHAHSAELNGLEAAGRATAMVTAASAYARLGAPEKATACLADAEALAQLRLRLDPFARELLAVLLTRTNNSAAAETVRQIAARAGMR